MIITYFKRPTDWLILESPLRIVLKWIIGYGILSLFLLLFGIITIASTGTMIMEDGLALALFGLFVSLLSLHFGYRLAYRTFYNVKYSMRIRREGIETEGVIQNVKTKYFQLHWTQFSRYHFEIRFEIDGITEKISGSMLKTHWYSKQIKEGKKVRLRYWKEDFRKARLLS